MGHTAQLTSRYCILYIYSTNIIIIIIIIIIGIQPLGRSAQRPEFSQATGMALVRCILSKFLGVACHCFPPLFRCSHFSPPGASTSATTWEIPVAEVGTVGENVQQIYVLNILNMLHNLRFFLFKMPFIS